MTSVMWKFAFYYKNPQSIIIVQGMCLWIDTAATKQVEKRCIFHMSLTSQGWTPQIMLFVLAVLHIKWRQIGCFFFF